MARKNKANGSKATDRVDTTTKNGDVPAPPRVMIEDPVRVEPPQSISGGAFSWRHILLVLAFNAVLVTVTLWSHYNLPTPRTMTPETSSSPAHFSEVTALEHISVLSDKIGYRIVGTKEHVQAEQWVESIVKQYEGWHRTVEDSADGLNGTLDPRGDTQVEVWTQIGDGSHR